ncbi:MAG TPA: hypothetical protein VK864_14060, partial [Longimicrobiales bacterium]|nr:hypothetical protein [Longimicrobiales bacterium]
DSAPDSAAGQQRLYLIGTENESSAAPFVNGANRADLFALDLTPPAPGEPHAIAVTSLQFVETLEFRCGRENGNFDAAAGIHFDDDGLLSLYTAYHWRFNNEFRLAEFHGRQAGDEACSVLDHAWIEIFEGPGFRGRGMTLHANIQTELEDYSRLFVQGGDFDDIASSVRFRLPAGTRYRLYRDAGYQGEFLDLVGDGRIQEITDLHAVPHQFGDRIRSSRFVS